MNVDDLYRQVSISQQKRDKELLAAINTPNPSVLHRFIEKDAMNVVASIGGYAVPQISIDRENWFQTMISTDPFFVMQVRVVANILEEYVKAVRSSQV